MSKLIVKFSSINFVEPIKPIDDERFTCNKCADKDDCEYAFDEYNTNGDCLKVK